MATLLELCETGVLIRIDPLEQDELPWRTLYATQDLIDWHDTALPALRHDQVYADLSPQEQVYTAFAEYVSGEDFCTDRRFRKLKWTPNHHVWEIKTEDVRIFGWVPVRDSFICCFGDSADTIKAENSYGRYIAKTVYVRNQIDLDEPKYIEGGNYIDVISNKA